MKAAYIQHGKVLVGDMPDPVPAAGQVLVRTHSCGMCASEQHFLHSGQHVIDLSRKFGGAYASLDMARPFVPGHEYVGEVIDYGPGSERTVRAGRRVTSIPVMRQGGRHAVIGFSHDCPGGWGEYMLLDEHSIIEVPGDLDDDLAAMTEPLAVGLEHARRGHPTKDDTALVIGCGAIGLGVIAGLRLAGIAPIVAADFHPDRRALALRMGADIAVDPRELSPYAPLPELGGRQVNLVYECVGLPGLLQQIVESVAFGARVVMGGYCMAPEQLYVFAAQNKRLTMYFAGGEESEDMALALRSIADGSIDIAPWVGARIGLSGVAAALDGMSGPARAGAGPSSTRDDFDEENEDMLSVGRFGTSDLARARAFYDPIAELLGATLAFERDNLIGYRGAEGATLLIGKPFEGEASVGNGTQLGIMAPSRALVDAVHAKALELGGTDEGAPGVRGDDPNGFYGAYFRDPDGNKLAVFRFGPP